MVTYPALVSDEIRGLGVVTYSPRIQSVMRFEGWVLHTALIIQSVTEIRGLGVVPTQPYREYSQ